MTRGNANVAGRTRHVSGNNCNVSSNNANAAGDIPYAGDRIASAGDRTNNVPVQRSPVTFNATSGVRPSATV